nr:chromatin assembly factor 1 subunit B [Leptinotarsa decemlineata]
MRCTIPEISWHNREPVLSVDIHPLSNDFYRLASGGGDSHILIWQMTLCENGSVKQEVISDLTRHQKAVNTVRWSSSGHYLASADDDANIIVWQLKSDNIPMLEGETDDKEIWVVYKVLRGHKEDIYDLCWSVDDSKLFSGSIDNTAILWDLSKGKMDHILSDHKGFVQGVAWDPKNQFLATISTDRICRFFDITGKHVKARIHKGKLPVSQDHFLYEKESKYFHDDTFKSFFRRLQFTPDGSMLIVPSGHMQADDCKKILNATLVFTMDNWNEPAAVLPLPKQCSTVVRCCPILFQHHEDGPDPLVKTPYRMIFAVGADHDVILYDTQQTVPFAWFHQIHYTRLTDLTWSKDGLLLIASSTDGFCALITFEPGELGEPYVKDESDIEENPMDVSGCLDLMSKDENVDINNKLEKEVELKKKTSFIAKWVQNTPQKQKPVPDKTVPRAKISDVQDIIEISDDENAPKVLKKELRVEINRLFPRRITPTTIIKSDDQKLIAKPIEVRRKPRDVDAKPIEIRRKPRDTEIKPVGMMPKPTNVEAKPIAVRRKPREPEASHNNVKEFEKDCSTPDSISGYSTENKEMCSANEGLTETDKSKILESESSVCEKGVTENVQNKDLNSDTHKIVIISENLSEGQECKSKVTKPSRKVVKDLTKQWGTSSEEKHTPNKDSQIHKEHKSMTSSSKKPSTGKRKKEDPPRVKMNSLVRKKLNTGTPPKNNSLLNFLKSSAGKKKGVESEASAIIEIDLGAEEARDAWGKESKTNPASSNLEALGTEEDCTEDFSLQLEDSQDNNEKSVKEKEDTFCETMEVDQQHTVSEVSDSEKKTKNFDSVVTDTSDDSNDSVIHKKLEGNLTNKVPRRVPLITLSSPKDKKKQNRTEQS